MIGVLFQTISLTLFIVFMIVSRNKRLSIPITFLSLSFVVAIIALPFMTTTLSLILWSLYVLSFFVHYFLTIKNHQLRKELENLIRETDELQKDIDDVENQEKDPEVTL
jgi:sensor histidine kinase YesM